MATNLHGYVTAKAEQLIGFYITETFNQLPMITAIETMRIANRISEQALYKWTTITDNDNSAHASNGMEQQADYSITSVPKLDILFISGPYTPTDLVPDGTLEWLADISKDHTVKLIGLETGCNVMAAASILEGYNCTTHWDSLKHIHQYVESKHISSNIFIEDRNRVTCAGGTASIDLVLYLIEQQHGGNLAIATAEAMIAPVARKPITPQRLDLKNRTGVKHPKLLECIELMEANCEEPLITVELAELVGLCRRQLERLFRRHLQISPIRYYLNVRIAKGRQLLLDKHLKIIDIALECGFSSPAHFSTRYIEVYGERPSRTRAAS